MSTIVSFDSDPSIAGFENLRSRKVAITAAHVSSEKYTLVITAVLTNA